MTEIMEPMENTKWGFGGMGLMFTPVLVRSLLGPLVGLFEF